MPSKISSKSTYRREVQVLQITADASPSKLTTVDTLMYDNDTVFNQRFGLEATLGHVPDLKQFEKKTNLDHLCLFNHDPALGSTRQEGRGEYYIYKCITKTPSRLPKNKSFGTHGRGRNYGDAFVFKVKYVGDFDGINMAIYDSMEEFHQSFKEGGIAVKILEAMAEW